MGLSGSSKVPQGYPQLEGPPGQLLLGRLQQVHSRWGRHEATSREAAKSLFLFESWRIRLPCFTLLFPLTHPCRELSIIGCVQPDALHASSSTFSTALRLTTGSFQPLATLLAAQGSINFCNCILQQG